jgi:hypothetical protein
MRRLRLQGALDDARWDYYWGDYRAALWRLLEIFEEVVQEPPENSEEYKDGQRKSATPDDEQPEEEYDSLAVHYAPEFGYEGDVGQGVEAERDDDGYLIR